MSRERYNLETLLKRVFRHQFASTAKKMKNDPHVTEVSDDGALLKRYRNEIVDLKRRLHEVSFDIPACVLQSCDIIRSHVITSPMCSFPGFFSHSDHSHGEGGALSASSRKRSAAAGARRPN